MMISLAYRNLTFNSNWHFVLFLLNVGKFVRCSMFIYYTCVLNNTLHTAETAWPREA